MFTLSLGKILVVLLVIVAAWKGLRLLTVLQKKLEQAQRQPPAPPTGRAEPGGARPPCRARPNPAGSGAGGPVGRRRRRPASLHHPFPPADRTGPTTGAAAATLRSGHELERVGRRGVGGGGAVVRVELGRGRGPLLKWSLSGGDPRRARGIGRSIRVGCSMLQAREGRRRGRSVRSRGRARHGGARWRGSWAEAKRLPARRPSGF